jgi:hypothetical protein
VFGEDRQYGDGEELAEAAGFEYQYVRDCGSVARAYELSSRDDNLTFFHHRTAMAAPPAQRARWLKRALEEGWGAAELRRQILRGMHA